MKSAFSVLALLAACGPAQRPTQVSMAAQPRPASTAAPETAAHEPEKVESPARVEDCSTVPVTLLRGGYANGLHGNALSGAEWSNERYQRYERLGPVWTCDGVMERFKILAVTEGPFTRSGPNQTGYLLEEPKCSTRPPPSPERRFIVLEGSEGAFSLSRRDRKPLDAFYQVAMDVRWPEDIDLRGNLDLDADGIVELLGHTGSEKKGDRVLGLWKWDGAAYVRIFEGKYSEKSPWSGSDQPTLEVVLEFTRLNREILRLTETLKSAHWGEWRPADDEWTTIETNVTDLALPRHGPCPFLGP